MLLQVREALRTAALGGYGGAMGGVVDGVGGPGSRIIGRIIDVTAIDDALALAAMTAGDIPISPAPLSQSRRGRLCQGWMVGNDDAMQQRDATRETRRERCEKHRARGHDVTRQQRRTQQPTVGRWAMMMTLQSTTTQSERPRQREE